MLGIQIVITTTAILLWSKCLAIAATIIIGDSGFLRSPYALFRPLSTRITQGSWIGPQNCFTHKRAGHFGHRKRRVSVSRVAIFKSLKFRLPRVVVSKRLCWITIDNVPNHHSCYFSSSFKSYRRLAFFLLHEAFSYRGNLKFQKATDN